MSLANLGANFSHSQNSFGFNRQKHSLKKHKQKSELLYFMY